MAERKEIDPMNTCSRPQFERICPKQFNPSPTCDLCAAWETKERFEYLWLGGWIFHCVREAKTGLRNRDVNWRLNFFGLASNFLGVVALLFYDWGTWGFNKAGGIWIDSEAITPWVHTIGVMLLFLGFLIQIIAHVRRNGS